VTRMIPARETKQPADMYESLRAAHTNVPNGTTARRAHELCGQRGRRGPCRDVDDWLRAEHEVQDSQSAQ
jgi:hypothetical protein